MFKIKPFEDCTPRKVLKNIELLSPRIPSLNDPRKGIRKGTNRLRSITTGIIDEEDYYKIEPNLEVLMTEARHALAYAIIIVGHCTQPLTDLIEYKAFEDVVLPEKHRKTSKVYYSNTVTEAVVRHAKAIRVLKDNFKSAPRYRKDGHDYFEDMIEMVCRVAMRPAAGKFARALEAHLGWTRNEKNGVFDHAKVGRKH